MSERGDRRADRGLGGTLGSLTPSHLARRDAVGSALALSADGASGLEVAVRSVLDPERAEARPGFFAAFPRVRARAAGESCAADTLGLRRDRRSRRAPSRACSPRRALRRPGSLRVRGLDRATCADEGEVEHRARAARGAWRRGRVRDRAAIGRRGRGASVSDVRRRRGGRGARPSRARRAPGAARRGRRPRARTDRRPSSASSRSSGVEARSLRISPTVELTYAIFDELP